MATIGTELETILNEFQSVANLNSNHIFVVGCSTSEVMGEKIGTSGTIDVAAVVYERLSQFQQNTGVQLAFQCCEHLNRALVVERETAYRYNLELVTVTPVSSAGGALPTHAYHQMKDPVMVEFIKADAGIDIGDTFIGMHLKHVAVPVRCSLKQIGEAHVTMAYTRPKLIGGQRAVYHTGVSKSLLMEETESIG
ncbi:MAG: TIGR01440 family protein [Bacillaceae bacterium]